MPAEPAGGCPLCGGGERRAVVTGYDRVHARADDYRYVGCDACGLVMQSPLPGPDEVSRFYAEDYYRRIDTWQRDLDKPVNRLAIAHFYGVESAARPAWIRACFRALSGRILRGILEPFGGNRLLDVGCATGSTLAIYRRLGWRTHGIEPNATAAAACRARGLDVHEGSVFDAPCDRQFDVVLLSHVIEHVREPVAVLRRSGEFLAPNGKIVLVTPNARGLGFRLYRSCWRSLDAPRHLFLFDPRTIRLLAHRTGLRATGVSTQTPATVLCESRHYLATQGPVLPAGLAAREALIARSSVPVKRYRAYRALMAPLALAASLAGRGDVLQAVLTARSCDAAGAPPALRALRGPLRARRPALRGD